MGSLPRRRVSQSKLNGRAIHENHGYTRLWGAERDCFALYVSREEERPPRFQRRIADYEEAKVRWSSSQSGHREARSTSPSMPTAQNKVGDLKS